MMAEFSILDKRAVPHGEDARAAFFQDLNLDQIIGKMVGRWGQKIRKCYSYFPADAECEAYRRAVYGDVKKEQVYQALMEFVEMLEELEDIRGRKGRVDTKMQRSVWQIREIDVYCRAFDSLARKLEGADLKSEGMLEFLKYLKAYLDAEGYQKMHRQVSELMKELVGFRFMITYEKDRMSVAVGETKGTYEAFLAEHGDEERPGLASPFLANPVTTELENACLEILDKKAPTIFRAMKELAEQYENYEEPVLVRFTREVPFYLSYCMLQRDMEEKGFGFATPTVKEEERMEARGLYDLALACVAVREGRKVVSNDVHYEAGESFFVLTGPNQGGKTTFARSLGQLVYFTKMGLDVPAQSANVHYFKDIQTHFSVEESVETGRGKLKEELIRLAPMMEEHRKNTFVVVNELFTTAASYDAGIMGGKVLKHFIELGCRGIYVTHLKELVDVHPQVVSLRAMLNEDRLQTFEIRRSAAEESACAANQVNKYRLTYEQLKERL